MACIDNCVIQNICTDSFPPVCSPILSWNCVAACGDVVETGREISGIALYPICGVSIADVWCNCFDSDGVWVPCDPTYPGGGGDPFAQHAPAPQSEPTSSSSDLYPQIITYDCDLQFCGPVPSTECDATTECDARQCESGCCCCNAYIIAEQLRTRCYDRAALSCNQNGSGPAPGETFPSTCDNCLSSCETLLKSPNGCSQLKDLDWWDLGNTTCDCFCKEYATLTQKEYWSNATGDVPPLGNISSLIEFDGSLLAGGGIYLNGVIDGVLQYDDGTGWTSYDGVKNNYFVSILVEYSDDLYAISSPYGGIKENMFESGSGANAQYDLNGDGIIDDEDLILAKTNKNVVQQYNGDSWEVVGTINKSANITSAVEWNGSLFVGGNFASIEGVTTTAGLVLWDGTTWADFSGSINGEAVTALLSSTNLIIATTGGVYECTPAIVVTQIATSIVGTINSMLYYQSELIVAGDFSSIEGVSAGKIAKWDDVSWSALAESVDGPINDMVSFNGLLHIMGNFSSVENLATGKIARWDDTEQEWGSFAGLLSKSPDAAFETIATHGSALFVGGLFGKAGDEVVSNIAKWNSSLTTLSEVQEECALTCAICGKCDAIVTVENVNCNYQFTLSPSGDCCSEGATEEVHVLFYEHGSPRYSQEEYEYVVAKITEFETLAASDENIVIDQTITLATPRNSSV